MNLSFCARRNLIAVLGVLTVLSVCRIAISQSAEPLRNDMEKPPISIAAASPTAAPLSESSSEVVPFEKIRDQIPSESEAVPLAKIDDVVITNQTVRSWLNVPGVRVSLPGSEEPSTPDEILKLDAKDLDSVITTLGLYEMANREALRASDFASTRLAALLKIQTNSLLLKRFLEMEIDSKIPKLNDEEAREWYHKNLNLFTEAFTFSSYAIFLSTYKPHKMVRGDTLNGLAKRYLGDSREFNRIIDPATSEPVAALLNLRPYLPGPNLYEGRVVMVPMNAQERQAVRQRMDRIVQELKDGADFIRMAQAHSEDSGTKMGFPIGPLPAPGRPILQEVLDAAVSTSPGQMTPVLDTKHGFVLLKIVDKHDRAAVTFEEARDTIIKSEWERSRKEAMEQLNEKLLEDPVLEIDRKTIMLDQAGNAAVIARVGDFKYTWGDYRRDTERQYSAPEGYENRVALLKESDALKQAILAEKIRRMKLAEKPDVARTIAAYEAVMRGTEYLEWYARRRVKVGEEALRAFYDKNRDRYREPATYKLREIVILLTPEEMENRNRVDDAMQYLREEILPSATSEYRFRRSARSAGNWPAERGERGDLLEVREDYRGPEFARELAKLKTGEAAGPFRIRDEAFLVWVESRSKPAYRPFAEVKAKVETDYRIANWSELLKAARDEIRGRHDLKLLFSYEKENDGEGADDATKTSTP